MESSGGQTAGAGAADEAAQALRAQLQAVWAAVAPGWQEQAAFVDQRSAELTERMLHLARLHPGQRVLELACGPGGVGLAAAQRVGPEGEVVLSDAVAEMTAVAAARADAAGLPNTSTAVLELESIAQPGAAYDAVLCREGLMLVPDPARAVRETRRILRDGGRLVVTVWGPRERNPWLAIVLDAVGEQLGAPVPPPGVPGPFALEDARELERMLREAGFAEVVLEEMEVPLRAASAEEWWARTSTLAGPLAQLLSSLPAEAAGAIRERALGAAQRYAGEGGLELPGVTTVALGVVG